MTSDRICETCWNPLLDDDAFYEENIRVMIVGKGYTWLRTHYHAECVPATATTST